MELLDRTERELSAGTQTVSGEIAIGGGTNASILGTAAAIRARYPDVSFYFHGGDASMWRSGWITARWISP